MLQPQVTHVRLARAQSDLDAAEKRVFEIDARIARMQQSGQNTALAQSLRSILQDSFVLALERRDALRARATLAGASADEQRAVS